MFSWKNTEIVIPAIVSISERADSLRQLLIDLSIQCPGICTTIIPQWKARPKKTDPKLVFELIAKGFNKVSSPWVFYMEEDIKLSTRFGELVPDILNGLDDEWGMVSFFSPNKTDLKMLRLGVHFYDSGSSFLYAQCVAMRLEIAEILGKTLVSWQESALPEHKKMQDMAFGDCCIKLGLKVGISIPNLVQHRCIESGYGYPGRPKSYTFLE